MKLSNFCENCFCGFQEINNFKINETTTNALAIWEKITNFISFYVDTQT
jgi:hypothetical protein